MIGFPLDSHVTYENNVPKLDRAVSSAPLRKLIKSLFSDGVMPNPSSSMQVTAKGNLNIAVKSGFAICGGCMKLNESESALALEKADSTYTRIDKIVLRLDDNDDIRSCEFAIKKGTPSASPVSLGLNRNSTVWEIALADITVKANATTITNADIKDLRYDSSVCGVISSISEFDTSTLYQQVQSDLIGFKENEQAEFVEWFEEIREQLSTDAAGNLQNQINVEKARIDEFVAQKGIEHVSNATFNFCGTKTECTSINAISNGICAEVWIRNIKWTSNMVKTYDTIAVLPDGFLAMTQAVSTSGTIHVLFEGDDIQIGVRDNLLRVYRKEGSTPKFYQSIMLTYALKNPIVPELSDLRVDASGERHASAGDSVRTQIIEIREDVDKNANEMKNVVSMLDSIEKEEYEVIEICLKNTKVDAFKSTSAVQVGYVIRSNDYIYPENYGIHEGKYVHIQEMKQGETLVLANGYDFVPDSSSYNMLVTDKDYRVTKLVPFEDLNESRIYQMEEEGYIYISCGYGKANAETKLFTVNTEKKVNAPIVLDMYKQATYNTDPQYGDRALNAILEGRKVYVKVPTMESSGEVTIFSPVLKYKLPSNGGRYLYLRYETDENYAVDSYQGEVYVPVCGELKMLLSQEYSECPLEV